MSTPISSRKFYLINPSHSPMAKYVNNPYPLKRRASIPTIPLPKSISPSPPPSPSPKPPNNFKSPHHRTLSFTKKPASPLKPQNPLSLSPPNALKAALTPQPFTLRDSIISTTNPNESYQNAHKSDQNPLMPESKLTQDLKK